MPENLNIQDNVCQLVVKALNKTKTQREAAWLLKISQRTLTRYKYQFGIVYEFEWVKK